jgi:hypothetical protein
MTPLEVTTSASGDLWCVAPYSAEDARATAPTLYKLTRAGSVLVSHPFPRVTVPTPSRQTAALARSAVAPFDLGVRSISAAHDGSLGSQQR